MFDVSFTELLVVFVIALLVFGPERLPAMAKSVGAVMGQLRRSTDALRREFYDAVSSSDVQDELKTSKDLIGSFRLELRQNLIKQDPAESAQIFDRVSEKKDER